MAQAPSRCINHPERTAVARCKQCHKPLCPHCAMKKPGGTYCSEECYDRMGSFQDRVEKIEEGRSRRFSLGNLISRLIILAIIAGILYYVFVIAGVRSVDDLIGLVKGFVS